MKKKKPKFDKELDGFALEGIKAYLDYHFKGKKVKYLKTKKGEL